MNTFIKLANLLGLKFEIPPLTKEDIKIYNEYVDAYERKDFVKSDPLRTKLIEKGIL